MFNFSQDRLSPAARPNRAARRRWAQRVAAATAPVALLSVLYPAMSPASAATFPQVLKKGGSLTVLLPAGTEGSWPQGLDPGTDGSGGSNEDLLDSIFGALFLLGPTGNTVPDLATGYTMSSDGKTYSINIRKGVTFSDGTPFNAAAVVYNWKRDFQLASANTPNWPVQSFSTNGPYTAVIHLKTPYSPLINSMHTRDVNFIASPTAIKKMGEKAFAVNPVGAGPFTVSSDTVSSDLVLKANPKYWQKGLPYLDSLTFKPASSDGSALEAMQSGQVQAYKDMTTPKLVSSFSSDYTVTSEDTDSPYDVQVNTKVAPFNKLAAREALYYAVDVPTLDKKLFGDITPTVEGFTGPGGLFYNPKVPGYRTYNPTKAAALVKQVGGISFQLMVTQTSAYETLAEGLQTMWQAAGMHVTLSFVTTPQLVQNFDGDKWQAALQADGSFDPAIGVAQMFRFLSTSPFSGVHDPKLDSLLNKATEVSGTKARGAIYQQAATYESQQAYDLELFPEAVWNAADKNVYAPGLTTVMPAPTIVPEVWWQNAGYTK